MVIDLQNFGGAPRPRVQQAEAVGDLGKSRGWILG